MEQIKNIYTQIKNGIFNTTEKLTEKLRGYIIVNNSAMNPVQDKYEDEYEDESRQKYSKYMHYFCCFFLIVLFIYIAMSLAEEYNDDTSSLRREILDYNTTENTFDRRSFPLVSRY